jgi:hypothetical protein
MAILFTTKVDLGMDERQVSCKFEPGLWHQNTDIENVRPETVLRNGLVATGNLRNLPSETERHPAKSRDRRACFRKRHLIHGDSTGWLGWEDSNSEMSSQSIPLKDRTDLWESSRILALETIRV